MQLYGIIGDPVSHSLSPIFQPWFAEQCDAIKTPIVYAPFHVRSERVQYAINALWEMKACGLNVTVPHKELLFAFVQPDDDARIIGAVNTLRRVDNGWQACNTDWRGMADVLEDCNNDVNSIPKYALLFGAGGTARATLHALNHCTYKHIIIANRNRERAQELIATAQQYYPNMLLEVIDWQQENVYKAAQSVDVLINTTSIGLNKNDIFPFSLPHNCTGIDAVYSSDGCTSFVKNIRHANGTAQDGLAMLVAQGAYSFAYWHDLLLDQDNNLRHAVQKRLEKFLNRC
ncbi:MAG: shikimate dehydrogenase [Mariprofundales bacterium]